MEPVEAGGAPDAMWNRYVRDSEEWRCFWRCGWEVEVLDGEKLFVLFLKSADFPKQNSFPKIYAACRSKPHLPVFFLGPLWIPSFQPTNQSG